MFQHSNFFYELTRREILTQYVGSITGLAWLFLQPLILLVIYAFVFVVIFQARVPEADLTGFVPYLAVAFWPWTAFAESIIKSSNAIAANAALIGKVSVPNQIFPLSTVASSFAMHLAGYLVVLIVLQFTGTPIHWLNLPLAVAYLAILLAFAAGMALAVSALAVFIRDLQQITPPLMMAWFFSTPILYSPGLIPERFRAWLLLNPVAVLVQRLRELLLWDDWQPNRYDIYLLVFVVLIALAGYFLFRRLSPYFEDFL